MRPLVLCLALSGLLTGAVVARERQPLYRQMPAENKALAAAVVGDWRDLPRDLQHVPPGSPGRPMKTLAFFGIAPDMNVVEISPGGGWYTQILAQVVREDGQYSGAISDPAKASTERSRESITMQNQALREHFAAHPEVYGDAHLVEIDQGAPIFGEPASADAVLTYRNVRNWMISGTADKMFEGVFAVLKPGGTLGMVEHRANADVPSGDRSGYVSEAQVIAMATAAGFELVGRSEVNANPRDTKDYPAGVWALPPTLREGDKNRTKYLAIGESDRMTLHFVKPKK